MHSVPTSYVPKYLAPPQFDPATTIIAGITALVTAFTMVFVVSNWSAFVTQAEMGHHIKLAFEMALLLSCTSALWKHSTTH